MKNVLNSFEFTCANCKDMLMRMLLLTNINIYYLITKYIYIYIFITLPRDKSSKLGMPYFIFPTFLKNPMSIHPNVGALVLRHRQKKKKKVTLY